MTSWKQRGREIKDANAANSNFLKFKGGYIATIRFDGDATERTFAGEDGKEKPSFEFPVSLFQMRKRNEDGELIQVKGYASVAGGDEKEWGITSMRLLEAISDEDDIESIVGRYFAVHCLGEGFKRQWKVRALSEKEVATLTGGNRQLRQKASPANNSMRGSRAATSDPDRIDDDNENATPTKSPKPTLPDEDENKSKAEEEKEKGSETCTSIDEMEKKANEMTKKKTRNEKRAGKAKEMMDKV